jgi:RNA recognition motif-containing protein
VNQTGRSKHYGFVEFDSASVAQIVAETMDNYLLMGHILKCKTIPKEKVHPELWVGANKKWKAIPRDQIVRKEHNKVCPIKVHPRHNSALSLVAANSGKHAKSREASDSKGE